MRGFQALWLLAIAFQTQIARASIEIMCADTNLYAQTLAAMRDMFALAQGALDVMNSASSDDPAFIAAFKPLFRYPDDVSTIVDVYNRVVAIPSSSVHYTIYCSENMLEWNDQAQMWEDTSFYYEVSGIDGGTQRKALKLGIGQNSNINAGTTPGDLGLSWTILGRRFTQNGETGDASNQVHIFLNPNAFTQSGIDTRNFVDIKAQGFDSRYTTIDAIDPPARLLLHELVHGVGGWLDDSQTQPAITDGENGEYNYAYRGCFRVNLARDLSNFPPTRNADSHATLAKMLYLFQVQGHQVWWSTGRIDTELFQNNYPARLA